MANILKKNNGFTLIEVLIALCLSGIVMGAVYATYKTQNESYVAQDVVVEMQQNLRAALFLMEREVRMAGLDPLVVDTFGITAAANNSITLTADFDEDGTVDADETITYLITAGTTDLCRDDTNGVQPPVLLAENIQALGFGYGFDNNSDGLLDTAAGNTIWAVDTDGDGWLDANLDVTGDGLIDDNDGGTAGLGYLVPLANIRAVRIWMLARTRMEDNDFVNANTYVVGDQQVVTNDNLRRRLLTTTVICRNMGI